MAYENYTVGQFKKAWFFNDRSFMNDEQFNEVYTEYLDTANLYDEEDFGKVNYIQFLNGRVNFFKIANKLQKDYIDEFGVPFLPYFDEYKKKGHILSWNNSKENFLKQIAQIELREAHYVSELETSIKELFEQRRKKEKKDEAPIKQTRIEFIKTINFLGKEGFRIDDDRTTVEELSIMICQQKELNSRLNSDNEHPSTRP